MAERTQTLRPPGEALADFIEHAPVLLVASGGALFHLLLYGMANHFPHGPPTLLRQSWLDLATPFWPWTAWIYASAHLLVLAAFWLLHTPGARIRYAMVFGATIAICASIHWLYPVRFPRELFPLGGGAWGSLLGGLRALDEATSALPSLHVAMAALAALGAARERLRSAPLIALWALAVALSTLTTKQHYAVDVVAGVLLAVAVDWAVTAWVSRDHGGHRAYA